MIAAALAAASATVVSTADAKPRHHRTHHQARHVTPQPAPNVFNWFGNKNSSTSSNFTGFSSGSSLISTARAYTGTNPTRRSRQWCGEFMGLVVRKTGGKIPDGYAKASSWAKLPRTTERPGAVAVMPHHVGIVTGTCEDGRVKIVSGNHGRRVGEGCYSRKRIIAFVQP